MDSRQARDILRLYRPSTTDTADPLMAEALELTKRDPELAQWFEEQCAFYSAVRAKLKQIEVPADLKRKILHQHTEQSRVIRLRPSGWWLAAAAAVALSAGGLWYYLKPDPKLSFLAYRDREVRTVQRGYAMEVVSADLNEVRQWLRAKDSHADFTLTKGLEKLACEGAAAKPWNGKKVAMICFNAGEKRELYLFVASRNDLPNAPLPGQTQFNKIHKLMTASWTSGDLVYVLAGPGEETDLQPYLN